MATSDKSPIGPAPEIDWQQVRSRLERAALRMRETIQLGPERARQVLEDRARRLALVPPEAPSAAEVMEVLTFALGNERYGLETRFVREVHRHGEATQLPGAPEHLAGIIALRGSLVPIFDLHPFFGLPSAAATDQARIVLLGSERLEFGFCADSVFEVITMRIDQVLEAPGSIAGVAREYLRGVTPDALLVLDGADLLQDARLFIDQTEGKT